MTVFPPARPELEKYELLEELGHGAMATVYRALDRRLGREVAVKIIHRHLREEGEVAERLAREARVFAKLRHPNIVEVFDVAEPNEPERYLVVEFIRGPTWRQVLRDYGPLPPEIVAAVGLQIADGLQHAHSRGVVHRDVKPENVLLSIPWDDMPRRVARVSSRPDRGRELPGVELEEPPAKGIEPPPAQAADSEAPRAGADADKGEREIVAKLTDFGIAKVLDAQGVTSTGEVLGSPAHMAPEQIEGQNVGPAADVFALGVLLYEALVGRLPFEGTNPAQVLRRVLDGQFVPADRLCPTVGSLLSGIVGRALAHNQTERYATAGDMAHALRGELERAGFTEPARELYDYFRDPEDYERRFAPRIVERLRTQARRAHEQKQVTLAASLLNRALALRPNDSALMAEVARITRLARFSGTVRRLAFGAVVLLLVGVVLGAIAWNKAPTHLRPGSRPAAATTKATVAVPSSASVPRPEPLALATIQVATKASETPRAAVRIATTRPEDHDPEGTRMVQVIVSGAAGSRMLIDGVERRWFGTSHELALGEHRFEVIPPSETCCIAPQPRTVNVRAGDGVLRVHLAVAFREAHLQLSGEEGTTLTCGELFPGVLTSPGRRAVRVSKAETRATCTLVPAPSTGERPRSVGVVLRPGGTFSVSGP